MTEASKPNYFETNLEQVVNRADEIAAAVADHGYAIIRGVIDADRLRKKLDKVRAYLKENTALPTAGISPAAIRKNLVKWSIGSASPIQPGISRFMLTVMNPMYEDDLFDLHQDFERMIVVRDALAKREKTLFDNELPKPKFNGTRLQVYPSGGGFMTAHIDKRAIDTISDISDHFIQLVMVLTEKGKDYEQGGAYVERGGKVIDTEAGSQSGDILVYDGNTMHGVADIDPHRAFDADNLGGRVVALVTIYN